MLRNKEVRVSEGKQEMRFRCSGGISEGCIGEKNRSKFKSAGAFTLSQFN
jgi:hypothetical protein